MSHAQPTVAEKIRRAPEAAQQDRPRSGTVRRLAAPQAGGLTVGRADDPAERAADRVADEVIARLQADVDGAPLDASAERPDSVQRSLAGSASPEVGFEGGPLSGELSTRINHSRGGGAPLSGATRGRMEAAFGTDLGSVRVHEDREAAELSRLVSARAFTHGQDIFFGAGEYRPDTPEGERVLAHEIAHTRQQPGIHRIHRLWDFKKEKLDWTKARAISTLKSRFVWFVTDDKGDDIVVKLEGQPVGLADLTAKMHSSLGTAASVKQKALNARDRAWIAGLLQDPQVAAGDSWGKFASENDGLPAAGLQQGGMDATNADDYGRAMALHELRTSDATLIAMTKAPGQTAEESSKPVQGHAKVSPLRAHLEDKKHAVQLGRITAVDLFLGNIDRVLRGNMGNWFYDPNGAVTLIDHVDQGTHEASKFVPANQATWEQDDNAGSFLKTANLAATVTEALDQIAREANYHGDKAQPKVPGSGFKGWLNEDVGGQTRREQIEAGMLKGLQQERAKLIKVFTATSMLDRLRTRGTKKSLKKAAGKAAAADQGHSEFGGAAIDYYSTMRARAQWLKAN